MTLEADASAFGCFTCNSGFSSMIALKLHNAAKHKPQTCRICNAIFANRRDLGMHKIKIHDFTRQKLGWRLVGGWNRGMPKVLAFPNARPAHGTADFMRRLNNPEMLERKKITRQHHEDMVLRKEIELRTQGYRTFCTSNCMRHKRVPDIIAISPDEKVVAVEMESMHPYKDGIELLKKKYTALLLEEGFFDEVIVEGFLHPKFNPEGSNTQSAKNSKIGELQRQRTDP